jgi:hypothetical protein
VLALKESAPDVTVTPVIVVDELSRRVFDMVFEGTVVTGGGPGVFTVTLFIVILLAPEMAEPDPVSDNTMGAAAVVVGPAAILIEPVVPVSTGADVAGASIVPPIIGVPPVGTTTVPPVTTSVPVTALPHGSGYFGSGVTCHGVLLDETRAPVVWLSRMATQIPP